MSSDEYTSSRNRRRAATSKSLYEQVSHVRGELASVHAELDLVFGILEILMVKTSSSTVVASTPPRSPVPAPSAEHSRLT